MSHEGYAVFSLNYEMEPVEKLFETLYEGPARNAAEKKAPYLTFGYGIRRNSDKSFDLGGGFGFVWDDETEEWVEREP